MSPPGGWPDEDSFVDFHHPSYAKIDTINDIIAGILHFHGCDVANHHAGDAEEEEPPRKRGLNQPKMIHLMTLLMRMTIVLLRLLVRVTEKLVNTLRLVKITEKALPILPMKPSSSN